MKLHAERLNVVCAVSTSREIGQIELNLVPALIKPHGHCADEGLHARRALVVGCPEAAADLLVVEDRHFEREVFLEVLDNHHKERQLDPERLTRVSWAGDVGGAHICAHDLQHT
eukprot:CAMPEP_0179226202 /NCGR_PEP_ID=MMETSP0797-20121207/8694_1 /TAXON_ID=47934 /ORGANISM="Dinophysis acuminata, Strain DAEP01" /LENGTH=113 /DNA_ID=CAMNT_0020933227 /DNA_START=298 /DNA_END=639 /DNA_ORIENTATION=-